MSNRLKFVLPKLVSSFQTCCILGRDIADTTSSIRDLIEIIENDDLEAYLIKVDQEKAFDKVDHDYLFLVLEKFGFGPKFMQWIKIFYNNVNSSVKCNGFLTNEASGAKINRQKSEIMSLGSGSITYSELDKLQIQKCENVTKVLGIYVGKDKELCELLNWKDKIKKIKTILFFWNKRDLTLPGRATVLTSLIMSRLYYTVTVCPLPEKVKNEIRLIVIKFLWQNKSHLVKYQSVVGTKLEGGLNIPDIFLKMQAFRLKFLKKYLDPECQSIWKGAFDYFITKIDNMDLKQDIVYTHLNSKQIKHLPLHYQEMINALKFLGRLLDDEYEVLWKYTFKYFVSSIYDMKLCHNVFYTVIPNCKLKKLPVVYQEFFQAPNCIRKKIEFPLSVENIYDQPLFVNPNIVLNNRTIVWHDFIGAGIVCLKDICFEVKTGFLPNHAIVEMIQVVYEDVNVQYVVDRYRNLLNVIPVEWKNTVNTDIHRISIPRTIDISIICKNVHYDLKLCSTKTLYTIMLENIVEKPVGIELWKSEFDVSSEAFSKIWEHVNMYWKPSNLVELYFKVLHNYIFTNVKL
ncbi:unnamed protein product [Mytilus coruscus]|uniref:Uncharacterized protein n=1 Tax=Mytilus coruscus TaxID=42192 RepID=A0A6J8C5V7_MYTCO|nr:unnamed protein product [Mytilus coruscus]